ncbi:MAG: HD domain-containing protein [Chitinivibrionia bacterium]|nr:HD domain-containing protein [Chitinivibrionia bacterium]
MTKTVIEKVASSSEAAVFKVGGTLGYHENKTLQRFFEECKKRAIGKIVLDFSELKSLGGGCARIIQRAADDDGMTIAIVQASSTVAKFLKQAGGAGTLLFASSIEDAVGTVNFNPAPAEFAAAAREGGGKRREEPAQAAEELVVADAEVDEILSRPVNPGPPQEAAEEPAGSNIHSAAVHDAEADPPRVIILGHDGDSQGASETRVRNAPHATPTPAAQPAETDKADELRNLKKKVVHYNALLTISSDFNRLESRESLIDALLLTIMAQIGVAGAAFYEAKKDSFVCTGSKGVDAGHGALPAIAPNQADTGAWRRDAGGHEIDTLPLDPALRKALKAHGFVYGALFIIHEAVRGIVFLGKSIRNRLDSDWTDFLRVLMNQAAISYEKTRRIEEESERTLGLVHTLISLIEENTIVKGTTNLVAGYTQATAVRLEYPKEHMKDLMLGTVLRDIGMIKVSDLILRSPRELAHEEWEIIKRHPKDGAAMLAKMNFSRHTQDIVAHHHERFNGEGCPEGHKGYGIPLGARIVSVVESYAAMLRDRPSRPALMQEEALHTLKENWGLRYDPDVVRLFVDIVEEEIRTGTKTDYNHKELFNP